MSNPDPVSAPYGAFALSASDESLRRIAMALPTNPLRRGAESIVRRLLMSGGRNIADIEVFPGQHARVHLKDNRCEKRVFAGSRTWDREERATIRGVIAKNAQNREITFVDAGANAGLYTLSVLADADALHRNVKVLAIEPDPENRRRLEFNLNASNAQNVTVLPFALGAVEGKANLLQASNNRGEVSVSQTETSEGIIVPLRPLQAAIEEAGLGHVDIMKMDIEGFEETVLTAFFSEAPRAIWPEMILLETRHEAAITDGAAGLCLKHGYQLARQMRQNAVLVLPNETSS